MWSLFYLKYCIIIILKKCIHKMLTLLFVFFRFSKENKQSINPYTYLPFGAGPRNCLGMRFALVMVKLALVEVLQNYIFSVCEETEVILCKWHGSCLCFYVMKHLPSNILSIPQIPLQMDATGLVGPLRPIKLKLVTRSTASGNVEKYKD